MKKVKINAKKREVRLQIPYGDEIITINEISSVFKQELIERMVVYLKNGEEFDEKKFFSDMVNRCTNVEFEGDVFEQREAGHEVQLLINEILIMINEVLEEAYQVIRMALQQAKTDLEAKAINEEKDMIINKVEKIEKEKETQEKMDIKEKKKPNKGRRVIR